MTDNNPENAANNTYNIAEDTRRATTSFGELRTNGVELQEASSTTFPPNDRFIWIRDGEVLNRDQVDSLVTQVGALYEFDVQPDETIIVRGKDRNAYIPGFDSSGSVASEVDDTGTSEQYIVDGIEFTTGYADLTEGSEEGFALEFTPSDVKHRIYKGGAVVNSNSVEDGDSANAGEYDAGTVTINTFSPEGKTIPRGRQLEVVNSEGGQGSSDGASNTETMDEKMSELRYITLLAQAGSSIARTEIDFRQRF